MIADAQTMMSEKKIFSSYEKNKNHKIQSHPEMGTKKGKKVR